MKTPQSESSTDISGWASRRGFLGLAAGLTAALKAKADDTGDRTEGNDHPPEGGGGERRILGFVGTYTPNGEGIYLIQLDTRTGVVKKLGVTPFLMNPSWLALDPSVRFLYSANEVSPGTVTGWRVLPGGALHQLNTVSSGNGSPAHLSVHPSGKYVFTANYTGGTVAVIPANPVTGMLSDPTQIITDTGAVGSTTHPNPPDNFAISGHDAPHAHMIQTDPSGKHVYWADLGQDRLYSSDFVDGKITNLDFVIPPVLGPTGPIPQTGAGPRHFVFHPKHPSWFYELNEEDNTVCFYHIADDGRLSPLPSQTLTTLPADYKGTDYTSEIRISDDGRVVYCANRLHNSIAIFRVNGEGTLTYLGEVLTRGDYPRSFTIDPTGNWLLCCNQRSDNVTVFRVGGDGKLRFTGQYVGIGSPAVVVFLR